MNLRLIFISLVFLPFWFVPAALAESQLNEDEIPRLNDVNIPSAKAELLT